MIPGESETRAVPAAAGRRRPAVVVGGPLTVLVFVLIVLWFGVAPGWDGTPTALDPPQPAARPWAVRAPPTRSLPFRRPQPPQQPPPDKVYIVVGSAAEAERLWPLLAEADAVRAVNGLLPQETEVVVLPPDTDAGPFWAAVREEAQGRREQGRTGVRLVDRRPEVAGTKPEGPAQVPGE